VWTQAIIFEVYVIMLTKNFNGHLECGVFISASHLSAWLVQ